MRSKRRDLRVWVFGLAFLVMLVHGCASLRPSASSQPPDSGGGLEMSEGTAAVLAILGPGFYILGQWLASGGGGCLREQVRGWNFSLRSCWGSLMKSHVY